MTLLLKVDGKEYGGWKDARITRGIERGCGDFSLEVSERWPGQLQAVQIKPGMKCEVYDDGDVLITGWVDQAMPYKDARSHRVTFSGRSKVADLVDCSAANKPGQWIGQGLLKIASDIAAPYGITCKAETDLGAAFPDFKLQQGEAAYAAIERLCRMRGVLACDDSRGNLTFTRTGTSRCGTTLFRLDGDDRTNILAGGATFSERDRFKTYIVKGQSVGTDDYYGEAAAGPKATETDPSMGRNRTLVVIAPQAASTGDCRTHARWERATRAGRSVAASFTVQGWREQGDKGPLWEPNKLVPVDDDVTRLKGDMLISEVNFDVGDMGTTTTLTVYPPEAFELIAEAPKKKGGSVKAGYMIEETDGEDE